MRTSPNSLPQSPATSTPSLQEFIAALKARGPRARRRTSALDAHTEAIDEILAAQGSAIDVFQWVNSVGVAVSMSTVYKYVAKRVARRRAENGSPK